MTYERKKKKKEVIQVRGGLMAKIRYFFQAEVTVQIWFGFPPPHCQICKMF